MMTQRQQLRIIRTPSANNAKKMAVAIVGGLCAWLVLSTAVLAYDIKYNGDKTEAKIYCDNGNLAGTFYWNGSVWSNGVNSGKDIVELAKKQVALNGTSCK